ncbi:DEAD/DEAH box helicase [Niveibacterium sp. 24ML]|uniref:DEAD/DEAH box helicase n=1 Tax=Niveibacterium sp. 24ML TaxID=2985512 RepID=UPI00226E0F52|nr:DEAD/DEAH box helicase [Niveibacterium sp. 24ML]MCX9157549.1 DEAD/DEAH box helicase [Niveibacterium sp. 24ML]
MLLHPVFHLDTMPLTDLLTRLDDNLLEEFFSSAAIARGRQYIGRVRDLELSGETLMANVTGSAPRPYRTVVRLSQRELLGEITIEIASRCSCPVGGRCKHVVALLLAARRPGALVEKPRAEVLEWAQQLRSRVAKARSASKPKKTNSRQTLHYTVLAGLHGMGASLVIHKVRLNSDGDIAQADSWYNVDQALLKPPAFVNDDDLAVLRQIRAIERSTQRYGNWGEVPVAGRNGGLLLDALLDTGRAFLGDEAEPDYPGEIPLILGVQRTGHLSWQATREGGVRAHLESRPAARVVLDTQPFRYLDDGGECGLLAVPEADVVAEALRLPPLNKAELALVSSVLADVAPALPPPAAATLPQIDAPVRPVLRLETLHVWQLMAHRDYPNAMHALYDFARAAFRYAEAELAAGSADSLISLPDGRAARVARDEKAEADALAALKRAGFAPTPPRALSSFERLPDGMLGLGSEAAWREFFNAEAPALRAAGWQIECAPDFRHHVLTVDDWHAELEEDANGWLALSLGIEVNGQRLDLAPLLYVLFRRDTRWLDRAAIDAMPDDEAIELLGPDGARIQLPAARIKPLASTLVDLFDTPNGTLKLSTLDAPRLKQAFIDSDWELEGVDRLAPWIARLADAAHVAPVETPEGFTSTLRAYQQEGLAWMQHLRAHELGGILADDMGLGKTAQTLAHLLTEKRAGRMDRPSLVVLPTSLVFNWQQEAARFAPDLRVLKLHGADRRERFDIIESHDVVLTTYPLLARDREALTARSWHYLILDEAQTVKNVRSLAAQVVREVDARHRLCLTGTPLENHLGELWSQFDFLMPGFLGDSKAFTQTWRTPIEKHGNLLRRELLARRLAPFILRRRKQEVAAELPPKTIIVRSVELEGRQRDLYETVRATMDKRIRDEVAARGFARSQIVILDALLKLRQVCCDPRLLQTPAAAKVKEHAKLDLLMDLLPGLVEEGRRVLLFSQFTTMLDLIEEALSEAKIAHVRLDGSTRDRQAVVEQFQNGDAPVFLISLKAGGVGLNLTAADTVIHFDPWWNPAAEDQATDRAHRIGQTKNVFVYKLVVAGSIEEKILALQEQKAALAAGILSEDHAGDAKFDEAGLQALFAPLPD